MPKNRRNDSKTHSIALSGLLFALARAPSSSPAFCRA